MENRYFNVKDPSKIVTIIDNNDIFFQLSDSNMIRKDTFETMYQPVLEGFEDEIPTHTPTDTTGAIDADAFLNSGAIPTDIINGIKGADSNKAPENNVEPQVVHKSQDGSVLKQTNPNPQMNESLVTRVEGDQPIPNATGQPLPPKKTSYEIEKEKIEYLYDDELLTYGEEEAITRRNKRLSKLGSTQPLQKPTTDSVTDTTSPQPPVQPALDPVEMMFSTFKRNHDISINVEFKDKIGSPTFIKMMVENMDGDIVGFYKKKVMEKIMGNLSEIELAVEKTIQTEIFGEEVEEESDNGLIPGGKTAGGKQKYKFVDENGVVKDMLESTAIKKGYEPFKG